VLPSEPHMDNGFSSKFRKLSSSSRQDRTGPDLCLAPSRLSAVFLLLLLAGMAPKTAAQTSTAGAQDASSATAVAQGSLGTTEQDTVTVSDHFKTFSDSTFATVGGAIQTVGAPLVTTSFSQLFTSHVGFADDGAGFGHHYGVNLLGNVSGKFLGKFVLPATFRQDERYLPAPSGSSPALRLGHIVKHIVIARSADHTRNVFNLSCVPNSLLTAALSNTYQPPEQRTAADSAARFGYNVLGFVLGDAYAEFQPDLRNLASVLKSGIVKLWPWHK
jgi:hypothetical protein